MDYDLSRFRKAQEYDYEDALAEIKAGRKRSHWIWYIFPQLKGLGLSGMSDYYGISGIDEARAYLEEPVLRMRLIEISSALLKLEASDPSQVMGYPDDMKLRSSMTLFAEADPTIAVFRQVLDKYWDGKKDRMTLQILHGNGG